MKYLIAALGNIGEEYSGTRHNIGFEVGDALVNSLSENATLAKSVFQSSRYASVAEVKYRGRILFVIKPTTYMNLSGDAVNYWLQKEGIGKSNLLVVTDDLALPFGQLRLKTKGSDGGHNGLKSIIASLQSTEFSRLRFGIGNEFSKGKQVDFVLGKWSAEESSILPEKVGLALDVVKSFVSIGPDRTMTLFNKKD